MVLSPHQYCPFPCISTALKALFHKAQAGGVPAWTSISQLGSAKPQKATQEITAKNKQPFKTQVCEFSDLDLEANKTTIINKYCGLAWYSFQQRKILAAAQLTLTGSRGFCGWSLGEGEWEAPISKIQFVNSLRGKQQLSSIENNHKKRSIVSFIHQHHSHQVLLAKQTWEDRGGEKEFPISLAEAAPSFPHPAQQQDTLQRRPRDLNSLRNTTPENSPHNWVDSPFIFLIIPFSTSPILITLFTTHCLLSKMNGCALSTEGRNSCSAC